MTFYFNLFQRIIRHLCVCVILFIPGRAWAQSETQAETQAENKTNSEATPVSAAANSSSPLILDDIPSPKISDKEIRPGDTLIFKSKVDKKFTGKTSVDFSGKVQFPYDISLNLTGESISSASDLLREAAKKYYKNDPDIILTLAPERKFATEIRGAVRQPGVLIIDANTLVDELIIMAGGLVSPEFEIASITLAREGSEYSINPEKAMQGSLNTKRWQGGDVLVIRQKSAAQNKTAAKEVEVKAAVLPQAPQIKVLGEVKNPGAFIYVPEENFYFYLVQAGGPATNGVIDEVVLVRAAENEKNVVFSLEDKSTLPEVKPGDLFLLKSKETKWEFGLRLGATLSSILSTIFLVLLVPN